MNNRFAQFINQYSYGDNLSNIEDITSHLARVSVSDKIYNSAGVPFYSDGSTQYVDDSESHTLVISTTGSGKTTTIAKPTARNCIRNGENLIVIDLKGDIFTDAYPDLLEAGYKVDVINFRNLQYGSRYNPLSLPYGNWVSGEPSKMDTAVKQVNDIRYSLFSSIGVYEDPFWPEAAGDMFAGLTLALFELTTSIEEVTMANIFLMLSSGKLNIGKSSYIKELFNNFIDKKSLAYTSFAAYLSAPNDTRTSMEAVFFQKMRMFFSSQLLVDLMSETDIDIYDLTGQKRALFIIVPDESKVYHPIVSIILTQIYQELIRIAHDDFNGRLPNRINFIIEEFGNLAIKEAPLMLSAARSRNIRFLLLLQTDKQLISNYGNDAQTIKSNCLNWIYLYSRELSFLKELSELLGDKTIQLNGSNSTKPLISVSQLQTLEFGQAIFFLGRNNAALTKLAPIWEYNYNTPDITVEYKKRYIKEPRSFDILSYFSTKMKKRIRNMINEQNTIAKPSEICSHLPNHTPELDAFDFTWREE